MKAGGQEPDHLSILIAWLVTFICFVYSLPLFGMKGTDTGDTFKTLLFSMTSISGERWNTRLDFLPMNDSIMHWHWRSGYKFMRAGVKTSDDGYWMHLGSTGCTGTIGNIDGCTAPNRPEVTIEDFEVGKDIVVFDLGVLFEDVDLTDGVDGRCMSAPEDEACIAPLEKLGLPGEASATSKVFYRADP